jgi:hypothetical protein
MRVEGIKVEHSNGCSTLSAQVIYEGRRRAEDSLWFRIPGEYGVYLGNFGEPFLAALLMPAMLSGEALAIEGSISPKLLAVTDRIQEIYEQWVPGARRIAVRPAKASLTPLLEPQEAEACFFSGGVDSFYTILKNRDNIKHLIFIGNFDGGVRGKDNVDEVRLRLQRAAAGLGKTLLEVDTNVRDIGERSADWSMYHGAALAATGLVCQGFLRQIFIAACVTYPQLAPWGTHPMLDPLWSTERLRFVHDGCEMPRGAKVADWVSQSEPALQSLRVCYSNHKGEYNCGRCEKCLRTMISLYAAGALERCETLPHQIPMASLRKMKRLKLIVPNLLEMTEENLALLDRRDTPVARKLQSALRVAIKRNRRILARLARKGQPVGVGLLASAR